jgi:hypothetical protein
MGDHSYSFASSVGHPRSVSVGMLLFDVMRTYPGTDVVLQVPRDNVNPIENGLISWVDHTENSYD